MTRRARTAALALLALGTSACHPAPSTADRSAAAEPSGRVAGSSSAPALAPRGDALERADAAGRDAGSGERRERLEPLAGSGPLVALEVPGFRPATVSLPLGATEKRPVVVALHGNYDRPEWQCEVWRELTRGFPFVVCPRGIPRDDAPKSEDRWHYPSVADTERELVAALDALSARHPKHVDLDRVVYTGFSLGAILGKSIVVRRSGTFARAVFTEGGYEGWSAPRAKQLAGAGVGRVLFACGQAACVQAAKGAQRLLEKQGVATRVVSGGNVGHAYDGPVGQAIAREWRWLVEGDARWDAVPGD